MAIGRFEIEYVSSRVIAPGIKHLIFKKTDNTIFQFIPGQFITFLLDSDAGKVKRRSYSIATIRAASEIIELAISYIKGGIASEQLFNIAPGTRFNVLGPAGRLTLRTDEKIRKLILVGTGTGITPYRTMLPQLKALLGNAIEEIYILLGVQSQQNEIYAQDFREYAKNHPHFYFQACLSRQQDNLQSDEVTGYVQDQFNTLNLDPARDVVYLCGNPNMIDNAFVQLTGIGFDTKSVRREKYISSN